MRQNLGARFGTPRKPLDLIFSLKENLLQNSEAKGDVNRLSQKKTQGKRYYTSGYNSQVANLR